jgi:hypothetical protein
LLPLEAPAIARMIEQAEVGLGLKAVRRRSIRPREGDA